MQIKFSVIVPTINRETLINCLESLKSQTYKNYEVLVVSFDEKVKEKVLKFGFEFFLSEKASASVQRNIGIKNAKGDIIAFIDDDAIANEEWLSQLAKHYEDENVACVGGKVIPNFLTKVPDFLKDLPLQIFKGFVGETLLQSDQAIPINKPLLWASNLSVRKNVFNVVGMFDENLGRTIDDLMGEEEIELQERILKKGFKIIYEPNAIVTHLIDGKRLTKLWFIERSFWQGYSEILKFWKSENFKKIYGLNKLQQNFLRYMSFIKFYEFIFELIGSSTFKGEMDVAKKMGRTAALSSLMK
jgi:glycosyltransferase involved in cell wall biosynthesis